MRTLARSVLFLSLMVFVLQAWGQAPAPDKKQRDFDVVPDPQVSLSPPQVPRSYALVVGISKYKNLAAKAQLQFPDRDAADMYSTLISEKAGQFPAENVHELINEKATLDNLKQELETWLPSVTGPNDRVLIYFAGHGFISGGKPYLAPYDVDPAHVGSTAFPMEELGQVIGNRIHGKWKVLLTDACHSGAITPEDDTAQVNKSLLDLNSSMFSLTASRDREQSFESPLWGGGHGIFTYYVIQGLQGEADTSGDGVVTADELAEYVRTNVRLATHTLQNPTSDRGSFDPNMVLAYNSGSSVKGSSATPRYGTFVIETNMDDVEVWLDGQSRGIFKKGIPQRFPGQTPGPHTVKGAHHGYEPDGPREEEIYPGQETTVTVRILYAQRHSRAAEQIFDRGMELYTKGIQGNYETAASDLEQALAMDPNYSQAALYLGRTYHALYEENKAKAALQRAIAIDPAYHEAMLSYAAVLLDTGEFDEAIRQLDAVAKTDPANGMAWYLESQAFVRKGSYSQAVDAGEQAVKLTPANAEAHLWLGEALRMNSQCDLANSQYAAYLSLSNFNSDFGGKLNYYVLGSLLGVGTKKRAAQQDIWRELRAQAYEGICDCDWMSKRFDEAALQCHKALALVPRDLFANYRLGTVFTEQYNAIGGAALLQEARQYFRAVIAINPDTDEAQRSRKYVAQIDSVLAQVK
jgi:tetratricopeptide (TPR) repeat protein